MTQVSLNEEEVLPSPDPPLKASGILFITGGKILLQCRGMEGDHPGTWGLPAGKTEIGETALAGAVRETLEETGHVVQNDVEPYAVTNKDNVDFTTFLCLGEDFTPVLNDEHSDFVWAPINQLPQPVHPGLVGLLESPDIKRIQRSQMNELDLARAMAVNALPSPQKYGTLTLFKIRITGTGVAFRSKDNQFVYKHPDKYLNQNFLDRVGGLPVIWEHCEERTLGTDEYREKNVGSVMLPFIEDDEVWCIARIYDEPAAQLMEEEKLSTSPSVIVHPSSSSTITFESGDTMLLEGEPALIDHLAVCEAGVWDKGGEPNGIKSNINGVIAMPGENEKAEDAKKDSEMPAWFKSYADAQESRLSALEGKKDAKKDSESEDKGKEEKSETKEETKDAKENSGKDAKKDSESEDKEKDAKKDSNIEAESIVKKDSAMLQANAELQARIAALEASRAALSDEDLNALAEAQTKADSVLVRHGSQAPRPIAGETPLAYRKRLAGKLKAYSDTFKDTDLSAINDATLFSHVESVIYKDSMAAAMAPGAVPTGELREIRETDRTGRVISTFQGSPGAWMGDFKATKMYAHSFKTN